MITQQPSVPLPGPLQVLAVLLLVFLARSVVSFPIEHVDASFKYVAAANLVRGAGWSELLTIHHTMRWSEVLPQAVVTWATQFRYEGLYILPLLAFSTYSALFWRGLKPALTPSQQLLLLGALFLEPLSLQHTGQLLNPPFGVAYAAIGAALLAVSGAVGWWRIALATLAFFCAYGAHSTYLAFFAGGVAWLLLFKRQPAGAVAMTAGIALLMALEHVAFNAIAGDGATHGRLGALAGGGHMWQVNNRYPEVAFHELLTRWFDLYLFGQAVTAGFIACVAWLALDRRARAHAPPMLIVCLLTGGAYALAITFAVVSIDPLRPMMPLYPMYLEPFLPFAIVGSVYLVMLLEARLKRRTRLVLEGSALVAMAALMVFAATKKGSVERLVNYRLSAFMWQSQSQLTKLAEDFREGEIMLVGRNRFAILRLIQYSAPTQVQQRGRRSNVRSAPLLDREVRCVYSIRVIPLEDNIVHCGRNQLRAARRSGVSWKPDATENDGDSL